MKTLHAITAISMIMSVPFTSLAESLDKNLISGESKLYRQLLLLEVAQKPAMNTPQECLLHLQETELWMVQTDDLLKVSKEIEYRP